MRTLLLICCILNVFSLSLIGDMAADYVRYGYGMHPAAAGISALCIASLYFPIFGLLSNKE